MNKIQLSNIDRYISNYKYISFDVFDTLIFRSVEKPEDIFTIVGLLYKQATGNTINNYQKIRVNAERKARAISGEKEIRFSDIFKHINYAPETIAILKELELQVELDNCIPNIVMIDLLRHCHSIGKKMVITTDMYLPRTFFEMLFLKLGIDPDICVISSEEGATKRTGELYPILLKKLNVIPTEVLHIGDNPNNDIAQAKKYGIDAMERWIDERNNVFESTTNIIQNHINTLSSLCGKKEYDSDAFYCGFNIIGPLLYDFCEWIHQEKSKNNLDKLVFLAREGYLIYKCYILLYPDEKEQVKYIRINKNLLRLPLMHGPEALKFFKDSLLERDFYTWEQIFSTLLISDDKTRSLKLCRTINVEYNSAIKRSDLYAGIYDKQLLMLIDLFEEKINEQKLYLKKYLQENGVLNQRIGVVNNSFNGNGQYMLESFIKDHNISADLFGLQFDSTQKCADKLKNRYITYFDSLRVSYLQRFTFSRTCLIFEHLLFEPIGTSLYFFNENNHIAVACKETTKEKYNYLFVEKVQKYAMLFVVKYKEHTNLYIGRLAIDNYLSEIQNPSIKFSNKIIELWDEDDDRDMKIADLSIPYKKSYIMLKQIPSSLYWLEGYLVGLHLNRGILLFLKLRYAFAYYRQNCARLIYDLLSIFKFI